MATLEKENLAIRKPKSRTQRTNDVAGYGFVLPVFIVVAVFLIFPILYNIYISFHRWDILLPPRFVGLANYQYIFSDNRFWQAVVNTIVFVAIAVPAQMGLGLLLAVLLNQQLRGREWLRGIFFSPMVVSIAAAGIIFRWMFNGSDAAPGLFALQFRGLGIGYPDWQGQDGEWAFFFIILMNTWKSAGYSMVIFLAGLQTIPRELYEAAAVDGIRPGWQSFRHITWPLLTSTTAILLITTTIFTFRAFEPIFVMTQGGPVGATTTIVYYIYSKFPNFLGYASAASTFMLAGVLILTAIQLRVTSRREVEVYG